MTQRKIVALLLGLLTIATAGCNSPFWDGGVSTNFRLALPLTTTAGAEYIDITVTQNGKPQRQTYLQTKIPESLQFALEPDIEATLEVTVFTSNSNGLYSYSATKTFVPTQGDNRVDVDLAQNKNRVGLLTTNFSDGTAYEGPLFVTVTDELTGFVSNKLTTDTKLDVPAGRALRFSISHPGANGKVLELQLAATADFSRGLQFALGTSPIKPSSRNSKLITNTLSLALPSFVYDEAYELSCGINIECDATEGFKPCSETLSIPAVDALFTSHKIVAHYENIPSLGCATVGVTRDARVPDVSVRFSPPYLPSSVAGLPSHPMVAVFESDEELDAKSLRVQTRDSSNGTASTVLCQNAREVDEGYYECSLDLSKWTGGELAVEATGKDDAGNDFGLLSKIIPLPANPSATPIAVALTPYPFEIDPYAADVVFAIDLVTTRGVSLCGFTLTNVALRNEAGVIAPSFSTATTTVQADAVTANAGVATQTRLWGSMARQLTQAALETGRYQLTATVAYQEYAGPPSPCSGAAGQSTITMPVNVRRRPFRLLTDTDRLVISAITGAAPLHRTFLPLVTGGTDSTLSIQATNSRVLNVLAAATNDIAATVKTIPSGRATLPANPSVAQERIVPALQLVATGVGATTLTAKDGDTSSRVELEVLPPPDVLALRPSQVVRRTQGAADVATAVLTSIGTPRRLIWDSPTDVAYVVGALGIQRLNANATIKAPCKATEILDAVWMLPRQDLGATAWSPGNLGLLVNYKSGSQTEQRYCEIPLAQDVSSDWQPAAIIDVALPSSWNCTLGRIKADGMTNTISASGVRANGILQTGCAVTFSATPKATSPTVHTGPIPTYSASTLSTAALQSLAYDPWNGYATAVTSVASLTPSIVNFGLGSSFQLGALISAIAQLTSLTKPTAVIADPLTGTYYGAFTSANGAKLLRFDTKFATSAGVALDTAISTSDAWTTMAFDAANRQILVTDDATPPGLWRIHAAEARPATAPVRVSWSNSGAKDREAVLEMIVAGPQPVALSQDTARPGAALTVFGSGFMGGARDEVYVQGIPAEVLSSTPTSIRFVVPRILGSLRRRVDLWVTVQSHGRLSGPAPADRGLRVLPNLPFRSLSTVENQSSLCGSCSSFSIFDGSRDTLVLSDATLKLLDTSSGSVALRSLAQAAKKGVVLHGGIRFAGHNYAQFVDTHIPLVGSLATGDQKLVAPPSINNSPVVQLGLVALDPSSYRLAVQATTVAGEQLSVFSATTFQLLGAVSLTNTPTHLAFMPDGGTLVTASNDATLRAYRLTDVAASNRSTTQITLTERSIDTSACPIEPSTTFLGLFPGIESTPSIKVLMWKGSRLTLAKMAQNEAGNVVLECLHQSGTLEGTIAAATLSPTGNLLAVTQSFSSPLQTRVLLYAIHDLTVPIVSMTPFVSESIRALNFGRDGVSLHLVGASGTYRRYPLGDRP